MNEITITLPVETINSAIAALAKFPYEQAQPHIDILRARAVMALQEQERAVKAVVAEDEPVQESAGLTD